MKRKTKVLVAEARDCLGADGANQDGVVMCSSGSTVRIRSASRELACRESDGLRVVLLWHPQEDALILSVEDARAGQCFELAVERDRALDAFYHPFAHAGQEAHGASTIATQLS